MYCLVYFFIFFFLFFFHFFLFFYFFFFFSSRRRHTRCGRDWSSDVCSSDLIVVGEKSSSDFLRLTNNASTFISVFCATPSLFELFLSIVLSPIATKT